MEIKPKHHHQDLHFSSNHDMQAHSAVILPFTNPGELF